MESSEFLNSAENKRKTTIVDNGEHYTCLVYWLTDKPLPPQDLQNEIANTWCVHQIMIHNFVIGSYHRVSVVRCSDSFPKPDDLQSEEQGATRVHWENSDEVQTCCCVTNQRPQHRDHIVLTGKETQ